MNDMHMAIVYLEAFAYCGSGYVYRFEHFLAY